MKLTEDQILEQLIRVDPDTKRLPSEFLYFAQAIEAQVAQGYEAEATAMTVASVGVVNAYETKIAELEASDWDKYKRIAYLEAELLSAAVGVVNAYELRIAQLEVSIAILTDLGSKQAPDCTWPMCKSDQYQSDLGDDVVKQLDLQSQAPSPAQVQEPIQSRVIEHIVYDNGMERTVTAYKLCTCGGQPPLAAQVRDVWEVRTDVMSLLFASKELADTFISSHPGSIAGGMHASQRGVGQAAQPPLAAQVRDAERYQKLMNSGSGFFLAIYNTRHDLRSAIIDAAIQSAKEQ